MPIKLHELKVGALYADRGGRLREVIGWFDVPAVILRDVLTGYEFTIRLGAEIAEGMTLQPPPAPYGVDGKLTDFRGFLLERLYGCHASGIAVSEFLAKAEAQWREQNKNLGGS